MTLIESEKEIARLVSIDRSDPEIYVILQKMIEMFLRRKKVCHCSKDYDDMSHTIAGDIYLSIVSDNLDIVHLLGYLEKIYRRYAHEYYSDHSGLNRVNYEDVSGKDLHKAGKGSLFNSEEIDNIINKSYLIDIWRVIDDTLQSSCKYDMYSSAYNNLKVSLILSLIRKEETYFHLNKEQEFYLRIIYANFKSKVVKDGLDLNTGEGYHG